MKFSWARFFFTTTLLLLLVVLSGASIIINKKQKRINGKKLVAPPPPQVHLEYPKLLEHKICIIVHLDNYEQNLDTMLDSIFSQSYKNFRVIFINNYPQDKTDEIIHSFITDKSIKTPTSFVYNSKPQIALESITQAIQTCQNDEIVVLLEGCDWFISDRVLEKLNHRYQNRSIWCVIGSYTVSPTYDLIQNAYFMNGSKELLSHPLGLKTFYAGLYKQIPLRELVYHNNYLPFPYDVVPIYSLTHLAPSHICYLKDVLYVANLEAFPRINVLNDAIRTHLHLHVLRELSHTPLPNSFSPLIDQETPPFTTTPVFIFSQNTVDKLQTCLESYLTQIESIDSIFVLYSASGEENLEEYISLQKRYPSVLFYSVKDKTLALHEILLKLGNPYASPFVLFTTDHLVAPIPLNVEKESKELTSTHCKYYALKLPKHPEFSLHHSYTVKFIPSIYFHSILSSSPKEFCLLTRKDDFLLAFELWTPENKTFIDHLVRIDFSNSKDYVLFTSPQNAFSDLAINSKGNSM